MSLSIVHSRAQIGVDAPAVTVEVHLANGLPSLTMVGLPEAAVKESKDRVRSAIINSGLQFPARRITLNLAPADLPKDGGRFDLAIALGILSASVQVPTLTLDDVECLGELALSGAVRAVRGVLPAALAARKAGRTLVVPRANAEEACLASGLKVIAVDHLLQAVAHFNGHTPVEPYVSDGLLYASKPYPDLNEVQGQLSAKRALLIAAAGAHNLLRLYNNTPKSKTLCSWPHGDVIYLPLETNAQGLAMTAAKLRIDLSLGLIEVEGSEAFILELYSDFKERISHPAPLAIQSSKAVIGESSDSVEPETLETYKAAAAPKASPAPKIATKTAATNGARKPKRSRKEEPKLLTDLDLNQGKLGRLKEFHAKYAPKTNMEQNVIFTYFLKDGLGLDEISEDHLFTCYRTVGIKIPKALRQSVLDTAQTRGWVDTDATGLIRLTTVGRNHIEHDIAKNADAA